MSTESFDVAVIGAGAGGGVVANEAFTESAAPVRCFWHAQIVSMSTVSPPNPAPKIEGIGQESSIKLDGVVEHHKKYEADYPLIIAPGYSEGALANRCAQQRVAPITGKDLGKLLEYTVQYGAVPLTTFREIFGIYDPNAVSTWVTGLEARLKSSRSLTIDIFLKALNNLKGKILDALAASTIAYEVRDKLGAKSAIYAPPLWPWNCDIVKPRLCLIPLRMETMKMTRLTLWPASTTIARFFLALFVGTLPGVVVGAPKSVFYSNAPSQIDAYDYAEITATVASPDARDPFEDVTLTGTLETADGSHHWNVDGFCDSEDGSVFRIRFMAPHAGSYKYSVTYRQGEFQKTSAGTFRAIDAHRRGMIRVDLEYPWHFIWEGTGEHFFFNGTTAYWLMAWRDEHTIQYSIERLHRLQINRIRVSVSGRTNVFYGEPVMAGPNWSVFLAPWPAERPNDFSHPGDDYSRFDVSYWQKYERMLRFARERDMNISLVLQMGDSKIYPAAGSQDEHRFIRYAVARFGAFSNITWDLGDDLDLFRDEKWTHETGTLLQEWDPYKHLETSHPVKIIHQDRASTWFGFTSYQEWSRDQHRLMLESRKLQEQAGRIIPQTNEEYGYEDHYPLWASPGSDSADVLRRTAWDITMAGGYQTAGETARRGTNIWPDSGGGWINGRGDDTMTMFLGYGHMVDFITSFEWWKTNPHDELVNNGNYCLAEPGKIYAVYLPHGGEVTIQLQPGDYQAYWFGALSGEKIDLPPVKGSSWTSPKAPDHNDWALLLQAK